MKLEWFIAQRQMRFKDGKRNISGSLVHVAVFGIALCIAVMIISVSILTGFKNEIRNKVIGFGSHIQIVNFDSNNSFETKPISDKQGFIDELKAAQGVSHVQVFATKLGIIKTDSDNQGALFKGIGSDFNWTFFKSNLIEGSIFEVSDSARSNKVLISRYLSRLLRLKTGDSFTMGFAFDPPRVRKFVISGIYETSVEEFDKMVIIGDIGHVQRLNGWNKDQISGFEIQLEAFDQIEKMALRITDIVGYNFNDDGSALKVVTIKEKYPQIFDWLNLQDMNVMIILIIMLVVSGFNMISGLLILILDRTGMIGIMKALGASNRQVRQIFLFEAFYLILKGLFWGNIIGIGLCYTQQITGWIKLDATSYYIDHVPVSIDYMYIIVLNIGTILLTMMMLLLPSFIISKFSPAETIKYN